MKLSEVILSPLNKGKMKTFLFTEGEIFYDQEQYKHDNQDIKGNEG